MMTDSPDDNELIIFLEPKTDDSHQNRLWCEDRVDKDWIPYVRADQVLNLCTAWPDSAPTSPLGLQTKLEKLLNRTSLND